MWQLYPGQFIKQGFIVWKSHFWVKTHFKSHLKSDESHVGTSQTCGKGFNISDKNMNIWLYHNMLCVAESQHWESSHSEKLWLKYHVVAFSPADIEKLIRTEGNMEPNTGQLLMKTCFGLQETWNWGRSSPSHKTMTLNTKLKLHHLFLIPKNLKVLECPRQNPDLNSIEFVTRSENCYPSLPTWQY